MYNKNLRIHFMGIGGIGMSGLATVLRCQGYTVSGCDIDLDQQSIKNLIALGCSIYEGHNNTACYDPPVDLLVYSTSISQKNPEIVAAQTRGIPTIHRAVMLAEIMRPHYSIAISGSHGKTTTSALVAHILLEAGHNPTVIVGGHLKNIATNALMGHGKFVVAEADESDRSFLHLRPTLAAITNISHEHLETYRNIDDIKKTFLQFLFRIPFYGRAILCNDDPHSRSLLPVQIATTTYGIDLPADIIASNIGLDADFSTFTIGTKQKKDFFGKATLTMPGKHNVLNALAAFSIALQVGIPAVKAIAALRSFKGVERRFSFGGYFNNALVYDDYGHHPREIYSTLLVARKKTAKKLIVVFQPHRYTRTAGLWNEFIDLFSHACLDNLIITDIYAASEQPIDGITSKKFVEELHKKNPSFLIEYQPLQESYRSIIDRLTKIVTTDDLVLFQGAGELHKIIKLIAH